MLVEISRECLKNSDILRALIEQVYYFNPAIMSCSSNDLGLEITLDSNISVDEKELEQNILKLSVDVLNSFDRVEKEIFFENEGGELHNQDPMNDLLSTRQVIPTHPGVYALQGAILKHIKSLDSLFKRYALSKGAKEQQFQPTLPTKSLIDNGYLSNFPHHPLFVANLKRDSKQINKLSNKAKEGSSSQVYGSLIEMLDDHEQVLSPTVCYHCFETLRNQSITKDNCCFTAIAPCHRHESRNMSGLSRLQTFTMREIVFFGSDAFVDKLRNEIMLHSQSLFTDWNLKFRIVSASDPFFMSGSESKRVYQTALALKYELQVFIPHSRDWLSVASFNNHQRALADKYNIKSDSDEQISSGCVGYGYERMLYSLYSQFGLDLPMENFNL